MVDLWAEWDKARLNAMNHKETCERCHSRAKCDTIVHLQTITTNAQHAFKMSLTRI